MINLIKSLIFIFLSISCCNAIASADTKISKQGETNFTAYFDSKKISISIWTRQIDIGKPSNEHPERRFTNCTYSQFPCSLVELLEIKVGNQSLFINRSVFSDLADINNLKVKKKESDYFVLTLNGGDASESYSVDIIFNSTSIKQRDVRNNIDGKVMQKTIYTNQ